MKGQISILVFRQFLPTLNEIRIYPNPATDEVTISSDKPFSKIEIYSVTGELIKQLSNIAENQVKISIGNYTSGMYFVHIFQEKIRVTKKLVINKRMCKMAMCLLMNKLFRK